MDLDRLPPQNIEAEQGVLGSILMDPDALHEVQPILRADEFYRDTHQVIYRRILELSTDGRPIDPIGLADLLSHRGELREVGGHATIHALLASTPHAANAKYYAGIVREKATLRRLIELGTETLGRCYAGLETSESILGHVQGDLLSLLEGGRTRKVVPIAEVVPEVMARLQRRMRGEREGLETGYPRLDAILCGMRPGELLILAARPSMGKAQPLDAKVLTPSGFVEMGSLSVGDEVVGADGGTHRVTGVFPQGELPVFRVTMTDGGSTECCDDHLWFTQTHKERRKGLSGSVKALHQIRKTLTRNGSSPNHAIPVVAPPRFPSRRDLKLHPYAMGLLLGDGSFVGTSVRFSNPEADIQARLAALLPPEDDMVIADDGKECRIRRRVRDNTTSGTRQALACYDLMGSRSTEKFIPGDYLFADKQQRAWLLRGLMDTDGYVTDSGRSVEYTTSSPHLAADVAFLARSLGGIVSTRARIPAYTYRGERRQGAESFRMVLSFPNGLVPVSSGKHRRRWRLGPSRYFRSIASIEPIGVKPCQCIQVDAPDQLYVTDDFIVTHNTALALNIAHHVAIERGEHVLFVTLEMDEHSLVERLLVSMSRIDGRSVRDGYFERGEWERACQALETLSEAPIVFEGGGSATSLDVLSAARAQALKGEVSLVVIDYIQLLSPEDARVGRQEQVAAISRRLKLLAREIKVPVLALSQLNRMAEARTDKKPRMSDLRESGSIEQDADVVLLLHRPEYYDSGDQPGMAELIVAKNRNGATGMVQLVFRNSIAKFEAIESDGPY